MKRIIHNSITKKKYTPPSIYIENIEPWEMIAGSGKVKTDDIIHTEDGNVGKDDPEVAKSGLWGNTTFDFEDDYEYEY